MKKYFAKVFVKAEVSWSIKQNFGIVKKWYQELGTRDLRTLEFGTRNPPQSMKMGPGTPLKFKSGTPGAPLKFKCGTFIITFLHCYMYIIWK